MQTLPKNNIRLVVTGLWLLTSMTGCAEWDSRPVVVDENFGQAVNNMVKNQTLYPENGQNDNPILTLDGKKAEGVIRAYREGASEKLDKAKLGPKFDVQNVGGSNAD
ncbi:hypothetical protein [Methyloglobulus sp.]|uniref:hypothetical protein n=1 Tax=Methyloglobulus sp. TaxID=2518622 RepID=UPI003989A189